MKRRTWRLRLYLYAATVSISDLSREQQDVVRQMYRSVRWWRKTESWRGLR